MVDPTLISVCGKSPRCLSRRADSWKRGLARLSHFTFRDLTSQSWLSLAWAALRLKDRQEEQHEKAIRPVELPCAVVNFVRGRTS